MKKRLLAMLLCVCMVMTMSNTIYAADEAAIKEISGKINASTEVADSEFGYAVSAAGDLLAVGAPRELLSNNEIDGAVYVYDLNKKGKTGYERKIVMTNNPNNKNEDDFGRDVDLISNDNGTFLLVGALNFKNGNSITGAAFLYDLSKSEGEDGYETKLIPNDALSDSHWGIGYGKYVALSDKYVIVGAYEGGSNGEGAVYVYDRTASDLQASQRKIVPTNGQTGSQFGRVLELEDDTLVVSAFKETNDKLLQSEIKETEFALEEQQHEQEKNTGAVYIYDLTKSSSDVGFEVKLVPDDLEINSNYGKSLAINNGTLVVGAYYDDNEQGSVYVFNISDLSNITQQLKLQSKDIASGDRYGRSVSLSGNNLVIGAYKADIGEKINAGSAYLYDLSASNVKESEIKFVTDDLKANDELGRAILIHNNYVFIGAADGDGVSEIKDPGAVYTSNLSIIRDEEVTVTFNTNEGSNVDPIKTITGKKITLPQAPTKDGYTFGGWYKDSEFKNKFDASKDIITGNTTLYAKWITEESNDGITLDKNVDIIESGKIYTINNAEQLKRFASLVNGGQTCEGATIQVTANIVLNEDNVSNWESWDENSTGLEQWTAIGNNLNIFKGVFDGGGYSISGIYINKQENYQGLFGCIDGGTIKNVSVTKSYIRASDMVGGIVGISSKSTIVKNCYNAGRVSGKSIVGGIVGYNFSTSTVMNCYNIGSITSSDNYVGGIVGSNEGDKVANCYNSGDINGKKFVGGISGYNNDKGIIENCYNIGIVVGVGASGVVGVNNSKVTRCYYDKQMCTVGGIYGSDTEGAVGKLTTDMVGEKLKDTLGDANTWVFENEMYPRLVGMNDTDAAKLYATPIFLAGEETVKKVTKDFTVGITNGVSWESDNTDAISIDGENATAVAKDDDGLTLTATLGDITKTVKIDVVSPPIITPLTNDVNEIKSGNIYAINNAEQLKHLSELVNGGQTCEGATIKLLNDIDISSYDWNPIGVEESKKFNGEFNGNSHTISGLKIGQADAANESLQYVGLFGKIGQKGSVHDVTVESDGIYSNYSGAERSVSVGVLAGFNEGTIVNCEVSGSLECGPSIVNESSFDGEFCCGGIIGKNDGSIKKSQSKINVTCNNVDRSTNHIGGLVGKNLRPVDHCYATGAVQVGVSQAMGMSIGGLVGTSQSHITNSCATGNTKVSVKEEAFESQIGGFVGKNGAYIGNSFATGNVTGGKGIKVGGFAGLIGEGFIYNCYATGETCGADSIVGGFAGTSYIPEEHFKYAYYNSDAKQTVEGSQVSPAKDNNQAAISKTSNEMKSDAFKEMLNANRQSCQQLEEITFEDWKRNDDRNNGYPELIGVEVPIVNYTITFNTNGGTSISSVTVTSGNKITLPQAPTKSGYTFGGWYKDSGLTNKFNPANDAITANTELYVKWNFINTYIPTYEPDYDDDNKDKEDDKKGEKIIVANVEKDGKDKSAKVTGTMKTTTDKVEIEVDKKSIKESIKTAEKDAFVKVLVPKDKKEISTIFSVKDVEDMSEKELVISVETDKAIYQLPTNNVKLDTVYETFGKKVDSSKIEFEVIQEETAKSMEIIIKDIAKNEKVKVMMPSIDFEIKANYKGKSVMIDKFSKYVTRKIALDDDVDTSKITTATITNEDGSMYHVPTYVEKIDGKYYAVVNSLTNSTYTLIYNEKTFEDIDMWAKSYIENMSSRLVVEGETDTIFDPYKEITRGKFTKFIVKALGLAPLDYVKYTDVNMEEDYAGYIQTASEYGIIDGIGNGLFAPNDNITREEAMTILYRIKDIIEHEGNELNVDMNKFSDYSEVSEYAIEAAKWNVNSSIIEGKSETRLDPKGNITKAEVATVLERILKKAGLIQE